MSNMQNHQYCSLIWGKMQNNISELSEIYDQVWQKNGGESYTSLGYLYSLIDKSAGEETSFDANMQVWAQCLHIFLCVSWLVPTPRHPTFWSCIQCAGIHFWCGSNHRADSITPSDRLPVKITSRGNLQFNMGPSEVREGSGMRKNPQWIWPGTNPWSSAQKASNDHHDPRPPAPHPYVYTVTAQILI
jgi:hypothetical protein